MIICLLATYLRVKGQLTESGLGILFLLGACELAGELGILAYHLPAILN